METVAEFSNRIQEQMSSEGDAILNPIMKAASKHAKEEAQKMMTVDIGDKQVEKERIKEKKRQRRLREKEFGRDVISSF